MEVHFWSSLLAFHPAKLAPMNATVSHDSIKNGLNAQYVISPARGLTKSKQYQNTELDVKINNRAPSIVIQIIVYKKAAS